MSKFVIQINGSVYGDNAGYHAYQFARAALEAGHQIQTIFFYQEGVYHTNQLVAPASDEINLPQLWASLAEQYQVPLVSCASAALRRGIYSQTEANDLQQAQFASGAPFVMGGLGELVTGIEQADRLICF